MSQIRISVKLRGQGLSVSENRYKDRACAVCGVVTRGKVIVRENLINESNLVRTFSARRQLDRHTFQWISCDYCGCLRASPYLDLDIRNLYIKSEFNYSNELENLTCTYRRIISSAWTGRTFQGSRVLDVGAGNGFVLRIAKDLGFSEFIGIEPSIDAIKKAGSDVKQRLIQGFLEESLLPDENLDLITMFHVLDHLPNPQEALKICFRLLVPNGRIVIAVHNTNSFSRRLLGRNSPIFDIEHTYLFNRKNLSQLLESIGFQVEYTKPYFNRYSISYLVSLLPLGRRTKQLITSASGLFNRVSITAPLGNFVLVGTKKKGKS
jgi:2-polyprenyl-3-methyl-5-hydroxy-6-metoxy-1,4-benzoquinol methylase